jgi:hypothetical protein
MQWWQKKDKPNLISLYIPTYILHFLTEAVLNFSDFCIKVVSMSDSRTRLR